MKLKQKFAYTKMSTKVIFDNMAHDAIGQVEKEHGANYHAQACAMVLIERVHIYYFGIFIRQEAYE